MSNTHDEALRWESWLHAYEQARDELPGPITRRCPNCGRACLRLVYRLRIPHLLIGDAHFWCDHCLRGPYLSRVEIPEAAVAASGEEEYQRLRPTIPNYALILPA
ncbi:hypothetical protein [Nonomuraea sp. NPDC049158]|uniref:hypothetical protein n=1 Tax=Nonomuraea sp. NPDC049158 TaxID=3155649 RepID=UPI003400351A